MHPVDDVISHRTEMINGIRLHWVEAGVGPLVVLLHGFPEFWYSWRHQIPALAAAGFRVVAPDLRGYNLSEKPSGYDAYLGGPLTGDVAGLIEAHGEERAIVVGHDWGGAVAWMTALRRPEVLSKLVVLNAPHPAAFLKGITSPMQILRSSYMAFFQLPAVPEAALAAGEFTALKRMLRGGSKNPDAFTDDDLDRYAEAFSQPGALTGGLAYYRAMGRRMAAARQAGAVPSEDSRPVVTAPTLIIWGRHDPALGETLADPGDKLVPNRRIEWIDDASHFVQSDAPDRVNELLIDFAQTTPL